jgi:hypothetical protein
MRNYIHKLKNRLHFALWPTRVNIRTVNPILEETDPIFIDRNIQLKSILLELEKTLVGILMILSLRDFLVTIIYLISF